MKIRGIPENLPRVVFEKAKKHYYDLQRNHWIAVGQIYYRNKFRLMIVAYDIINDTIEIITVHPIKGIQITHRVETGRWIEK